MLILENVKKWATSYNFKNCFKPKVTQAYWSKTKTDCLISKYIYVFNTLKATFQDFKGIFCRAALIGRDYRQKLLWCVRSQGDQYFTKTKTNHKTLQTRAFLYSRKEPEVPPEKVGGLFRKYFFLTTDSFHTISQYHI